MSCWQFYALWVTRNGQRQWSGPHPTMEAGWAAMDALMYCTGQRVAQVRETL